MGLHNLSPDGYEGGAWGNVPTSVVDVDGVTVAWDGVNDSEARYTLSAMREALSIASITVFATFAGGVGDGRAARVLIRTGSTTTYATYTGLGTGQITISNIWLVDPVDGLPFTKAKLDAYAAGVSCRDTSGAEDTIRLDRVLVQASFTPAPTADAERERATRALRQSSSPTKYFDLKGPIQLGDVRMLGLLPVSHPLIPSPDGLGAGEKVHQRRPMIVTVRRYDPARYTWTLTGLDVTPGVQLYSLYRSLRSRQVAAATLPGLMRADASAVEVLTRASRAWVPTPDGRVVGLTEDQLKMSRHGTWFEPARTNLLLRSSFKSGVTGLTAVGTAGQSTADTTDLLFEPAESGNSLKITRNATAEDQGRSWPAVAYLANDNAPFSIDYKNDSGVAVKYRIQRTNGNYWRDSDGTWQATLQNNSPPVVTSRDPANRHLSKIIPVGGSNTSLTLSVVHLSADASGVTSHIYHCQLEKGLWASSRKITDTATFSGLADLYTITSHNPPHILPLLRGTAFALVIADWNSVDDTAASHYVLRSDLAVNNRVALFYDGLNGRWSHTRIINNTTVQATKTQAVTRGTAYVVAWRWISDQGELGLATGTQSVFVDGVKGTDAAPGGGAGAAFCPVPTGSIAATIGAIPAGGSEWGGRVAEVLVTPLLLTDEMIADISAYLLATALSTT